jgi:nucleotidyltransferase/DNA polymerase involved in DNA repair
VSKQVQATFKDYTPLVEPLSLDEAYLDVTDNLRGIPTAWETAKEIRARIYEETRLTASAGTYGNKFLAKIASDYRKPNGQFAIIPDQAEACAACATLCSHQSGHRTFQASASRQPRSPAACIRRRSPKAIERAGHAMAQA